MLGIGKAFYDLKNKLSALYDEREAAAIAHEVLTHITGLSKAQRLMQKDDLLSNVQGLQYEQAVAALLAGTPLQYITGKAWFMGREFVVNDAVLIPRPETEELVQWVIDDLSGKSGAITILDVGTGSGCIPVSLKLALPAAQVLACDISSPALQVAAGNAGGLSAPVAFMQLDILDAVQYTKLPACHVIVSNPPYIPMADKAGMHTNVKDHEPQIALFVPDGDALVFYRAIALLGHSRLGSGGAIYCELDAAHAAAARELFEAHGYVQVSLRKDMHDNWRMLKACKA